VLGLHGDDVLAALLVERRAPLSARLIDSVAPEVKTSSLPLPPRSDAIWSRAWSTAASAVQPNEWLRLAALPNWS
jgi:hypothetical protein